MIIEAMLNGTLCHDNCAHNEDDEVIIGSQDTQDDLPTTDEESPPRQTCGNKRPHPDPPILATHSRAGRELRYTEAARAAGGKRASRAPTRRPKKMARPHGQNSPQGQKRGMSPRMEDTSRCRRAPVEGVRNFDFERSPIRGPARPGFQEAPRRQGALAERSNIAANRRPRDPG